MATPSAKNGLALGFVRRFREKIGNIGRHDFAVGSHALPALRFLVDDLRNEIGLENVAAQADGHPFFAIEFETVDGRVVDLVGLRLFNAQQIGDFLGGDILLSNDELQSESSRFPTYIYKAIAQRDWLTGQKRHSTHCKRCESNRIASAYMLNAR